MVKRITEVFDKWSQTIILLIALVAAVAGLERRIAQLEVKVDALWMAFIQEHKK